MPWRPSRIIHRPRSRAQLATRGANTGQCENCGLDLAPPGAVRLHGTLVACLECHFVHQLALEDGAWTADALMCRAVAGACDDEDDCPLLADRTRTDCPYTPWSRAEQLAP